MLTTIDFLNTVPWTMMAIGVSSSGIGQKIPFLSSLLEASLSAVLGRTHLLADFHIYVIHLPQRQVINVVRFTILTSQSISGT
jgi:hypothetical protein